MRDAVDWTEADLRSLVAHQVGESLTLDYKQSAALAQTDGKKNELSKDVSALANSAGGVLVYGISENGHVPVALDGGSDPMVITKEWLEQVISSRIAPRIEGVRVRQVPLSGTASERVAYVVVVPASARAPHMAADHRYYKRFNFESAPMEDYEVRDVSRRFVAPNLRLGVELKPPDTTANVSLRPTLSLHVENLSPAPAEFALVTFHLSSASTPDVQGVPKVADSSAKCDGKRIQTWSYKVEWRGSLRLPIFQGARYHIADLSLSLAASVGAGWIFWEVFTPGAEPKCGGIWLNRHNGQLAIDDALSDLELPRGITWHI